MKFREWLAEGVRITGYDPDGDLDDLADQAWAIARNSPIRILSDKELSHIAHEGGRAVGAVFSSCVNGVYSFDIVADPKAGGVLSLMLIRAGLNDFDSCGPDSRVELDVTNPKLVPILSRRFGFEVARQLPGHTIMIRG